MKIHELLKEDEQIDEFAGILRALGTMGKAFAPAARQGLRGAGTQTLAVAFGGGDPTALTTTELWNGTSWEQRGSDIDGEAGQDQSGSSVSLSADGSNGPLPGFQ